MSEFLDEIFGDITSKALEIRDHIPPYVEYESHKFFINVELFRGDSSEWYTEKRWLSVFSPEDIKDKISRPDGGLILVCEFYDTVYTLLSTSATQLITIAPCSLGSNHPQENLGDDPNELSIKISDCLNWTPHMNTRAVLVKKQGENYENDVETLANIESVSSIKNLTCNIVLHHRSRFHVEGREYISSHEFEILGQGGRLFIDDDCGCIVTTPEEAFRTVKTKSVLYRFFSFL